MRKEYKTGTAWCFWRWTDVDSNFLTRLHVVKTPWFAICVHWIRKPDPEPWLHDHPVSFLSIILRGSYIEQRWDTLHSRRWFNFIRATDAHTIVAVEPHTVTLAFMGPKVRNWGYHTNKGWIYWRDYYAEQRAQSNG